MMLYDIIIITCVFWDTRRGRIMAGWMVVAKLKTEPHSELTYTYDVNTGKVSGL